MLEQKKLALIRILEILNKKTDSNHTLKQEQIRDILYLDYGIEIERKSIGSNIALLQDLGYEIAYNNGYYLAERKFEDSELRMLIDAVLSSQYISTKHSNDLIEKLCSLSSEHFKEHVKNIYFVKDWNKTHNNTVLYNVDIINEALDQHRKITFDYNKFNVDAKLEKVAHFKESPLQMLLKNQHYYLMSYNERWNKIHYLRIDKITNIKITKDVAKDIHEIEGYKKGINYRELSNSLPYMFSDKPQTVRFLADKWVIDQVIDWFGKVEYEEQDDKYLITITASLDAMKYWALQYIDVVEVIEPKELRDKISESMMLGYKKYNDGNKRS